MTRPCPSSVANHRRAARGFGLALLLALLFAAALLVVGPSPAPAADMTPVDELLSVATPVIGDQAPTFGSGTECLETEPDETDTVATVVDNDFLAAATPAAAIEEIPQVAEETGPCAATPDETPLPTEIPVQVTTTNLLDNTPESGETTASPGAEETIALPAVDPLFIGLPTLVADDERYIDPFENGLPSVVNAPPAPEPSMSGFPAMETEAIPTIEPSKSEPSVDEPAVEPLQDPSLAGIPETDTTADPMLSGFALESDVGVIVDVVSVDGTITPGGAISYRFRVMNPASIAVTVQLEAATDLPGWSAAVWLPGAIEPLTGAQFLSAGDEMELLVIVTAPREASIGDQVTTSLTAIVQP